MSNRHGSAVVTLPSDTEILITRQFDAPAALVWEALTRPEHIKRWWGPEWCPITSAEIDLRVGGSWRYVCRMDDGTELGWHGEYREIDRAPQHHLDRGVRGLPRRRVAEHDDAHRVRAA